MGESSDSRLCKAFLYPQTLRCILPKSQGWVFVVRDVDIWNSMLTRNLRQND